MTPEEISQLVEAAVGKAVDAVLKGMPGGGGKGSRRVLEPKGIGRVDSYSGKEGTWREWSFQFRVAVKAMNRSAEEVLTKVERNDQAHVLEDLELEYD